MEEDSRIKEIQEDKLDLIIVEETLQRWELWNYFIILA